MTNSVAEIREAEVLFVCGSNTTEAHPVIGAQVRQAVNRGAKLIVIDPMAIPLTKDAELYLQVKPGTNIALINAIINVILEEGLEDKDYIENNTEDFDKLKETVKKYTPEYAAKICEVDAEDIRKAARLYTSVDKASILYTLGVTEHHDGTENVMSLSNLALVTGNLGRESTGVNPLRGQNNVQGACDMGALPNVFCGYQAVTNPEAVAKFEKAWGTKLPNNIGLTIPEVADGAVAGDVKILYVFGEDPVVTDPNTNHVRAAMEKTFLIVQDLFLTETAELADVVLPAACFAEKDGTFTNTERRVQRVRKAVDAPGEAKADWEIISEIMRRLGYDANYNNTEEIFDEMCSLTPQYAGMSYKRIDNIGLQWPCPTQDHPGTKFLHAEKPVRGKGLFMALEFEESPELAGDEYPIILTTGRILEQYNNASMTGRTEGIHGLAPDHYIEINEKLAVKKGIKDGDMVEVTSRWGKLETRAVLTNLTDENVVYMAFHWIDSANILVGSEYLDKYSKTAGYKVTGVRLEKKA